LGPLYDGESFFSYSSEDGVPHDWVESLLEDDRGNLWIGTEGGGVCKFDGNTFTTFTRADGLADDTVRALGRGPQGHVWVATEIGVSQYSGG